MTTSATCSTFTELFAARAEQLGPADAHVFLPDDAGAPAQHLSYGQLDRAARGLAVRLTERYGVIAGQPVLLLYPPGPEFLKAFMGCLYAGAVAVPAPLPGGRGAERVRRVTGIVRDAGVRLVLTDAEHAPDVSVWLAMSGRGHGVVCLPTDVADPAADPDAWRPPDIGPDDLALLQYTSGSTTQPRGVMVSHRNLLANQAALQRVLGSGPDDRFAGWLPHYHDLGLMAQLLHPLWLGTVAVQLSARAFVKHPARWLRAIDTYGATIACAPDFAYDLCTRRITDDHRIDGLDLSRWRIALNGAEPVRRATLDAFTRRFARAGLRPEAMFPAYGLAEATLCVSGGAPGRPYTYRTVSAPGLEQGELRAPCGGEPTRDLVSSGRVPGFDGCGDFDVVIVDDVGRPLPDGRVGEIWLRGDSVAQGYWRRQPQTLATFGARTADGRGGFLRTGDLGALDGGELYVTGRIKEVIVRGGRNLYPQDIEWAVRETSTALGAGHGAVFTVPVPVPVPVPGGEHGGGGDREHLVVVHEVHAPYADGERLRALTRRVQTVIGTEFEVPAANVLLVAPGTVRRTTSGKVQRTRMRQLFLDGELAALHEHVDPAVRALIRPEEARLGAVLVGGDGDVR
ncbi:fatty acyl-AMP ligase [Streptomyces sp. NPDC002851]